MAQLLCVNGPEAANSLSVALVHEHLFLDHSRLLQRPPLPLDLEHLADIRQQPSRCLENLRLDSVDHIASEIARFGELTPGVLLLDTTSPLDGRNTTMLQRLSRTPIGPNAAMPHVACCTGPSNFAHDVRELADSMARELAMGCEGGAVRPVAMVLPIGHWASTMVAEQHAALDEAQMHIWIDAARAVRERIPAPAIVECGYDVARTEAIIQRFCQADPTDNSWVVLSEVAARPEQLDTFTRWLARGFHICVDAFGHVERPALGAQLPSDDVACQIVLELCRRGFERQLHLSTNLRRKMQLRRFGGYGLAHITDSITPTLQALGVNDETMQRLIGGNALALLAYYQPPAEREVFVPKLTCSVCGKKFPETSPDFFTKFQFVYCSSQCLREHRNMNFRPLPDQHPGGEHA